MALIYLGVLGLEYAIAAGALIYGLEHLPSFPPPDSGDDAEPDTDPDSGVAPDDSDPNNDAGGIIPGTEVPMDWRVGPFDTHASLTMLEARRQWALLRRAWDRTKRHIPWMTVSTIVAVYRGYHIYLSMREAVALRRATIALSKGQGVPHDTPLPVRKMMYLAHYGVNEGVRRGIKRVAGSDPFGSPPP